MYLIIRKNSWGLQGGIPVSDESEVVRRLKAWVDERGEEHRFEVEGGELSAWDGPTWKGSIVVKRRDRAGRYRKIQIVYTASKGPGIAF